MEDSHEGFDRKKRTENKSKSSAVGGVAVVEDICRKMSNRPAYNTVSLVHQYPFAMIVRRRRTEYMENERGVEG